MGLACGLLFVPCAGPILAAITVVGATHRVGWTAVFLTAAFAAGAALPLLVVAVAGSELTRRARTLRNHAPKFRMIGGAVLVAMALAIGFNSLRRPAARRPWLYQRPPEPVRRLPEDSQAAWQPDRVGFLLIGEMQLHRDNPRLLRAGPQLRRHHHLAQYPRRCPLTISSLAAMSFWSISGPIRVSIASAPFHT